MRPRNAELSLLILAIVISVAVVALTDLARAPHVTKDVAAFAIIFGALAIGGHFAVRRYAPSADPLLYSLAILLSGFGYGIVRRLDDPTFGGTAKAGPQLGWIAIGIVAFIATLAFLADHRRLEQFRYSFMLLGVGLLLLPTFVGRTVNGARLWIDIGPLHFQPAEIAKIMLALFCASYLAAKREVMTISSFRIGRIGIPAPRHFGPLLLAWGISLAVMFYEKDLGSSLLFFSLFLVTLYAATSRAVYPVLGIGMFGVGVAIAINTFSHVANRVHDWLDPWSTILGSGRQIAQSAFALGTGGFTGVGIALGHSQLIDPRLASGTLPTDFIFAAIGEELGFLGTVAIVLVFALITARGFHIALRSRDEFGTLLAVGLTAIISLQAVLIMGGVSRLLPLTGITLPFVSYGGSSILANFILIALLMRISDGEAVT